jgi:isopentenyl-diphosphate delta-isomerase
MPSPETIITVVDEHDNVVGHKPAGELNPEKDIYRVSSVWITNDKDEVLLARRSFTKKIYPGVWDVGVAGTIEQGETYEENAAKEAHEELGITEPLTVGPKVKIEGKYNMFLTWFFLRTNKRAEDFVFQKEEIEEVKWFSKNELVESLKKNPEEFIA